MPPEPVATPEPVPSYSDVALGTAPWWLDAARSYVGKTDEETFEMLMAAGGGMEYVHDLLWVGPVAFRYYIRPLMRYVITLGLVHNPKDGETCDPDFVSAMAGLLETWLERHPAELVGCAGEIETFCQAVFSDFPRFDTDPEIYVGLEEKYQSLAHAFHRLLQTDPKAAP